MVRGYILTERERKIVNHYFKTGVKIESFNVLLHELRKAYPNIKSDMELVEKLLEK